MIRAVFITAKSFGCETIGFRDGFEGLYAMDTIELGQMSTINDILHLGGTILGTSNVGEFACYLTIGTNSS